MKTKALLILFSVALFVSCSSAEEEPTPREEPNVEVEVMFFNYTLDAAKENFVWEYEVKFHNHSSYTVHGVPLITYTFENDESVKITPGYYEHNNPCPSIKAGETCTVSFYKEGEVDRNVEEEPTILKFVEAEYYIDSTEE